MADRKTIFREAQTYALTEAVADGDLDAVRYFVRRGANVRVYNDGLFCRAIRYNHFEILKYLMLHVSNVHTMHRDVLYTALVKGNYEIIEYLIVHGVYASTDDYYALLSTPTIYWRKDIIKLILRSCIWNLQYNPTTFALSCYINNIKYVKWHVKNHVKWIRGEFLRTSICCFLSKYIIRNFSPEYDVLQYLALTPAVYKIIKINERDIMSFDRRITRVRAHKLHHLVTSLV